MQDSAQKQENARVKELNRRDWIAGLEKGLSILEAFNHDHQKMTATQVSMKTGLTRTAARRYLLTLEHLGYLRSDGKHFYLTPRVLKVGWSYFDSAALPRILQPFLQQLSGATNEPAYASVLDDDALVCIARNGVARVMTTGFVLGARVPAQWTAAGRILLGYWPEQQLRQWLQARIQANIMPYTSFTELDLETLLQSIRQARADGFAIVDQQIQMGVRGIAVPIKDRQGRAVAALHLNVVVGDETSQQLAKRVLPAMTQVANAMMNYL